MPDDSEIDWSGFDPVEVPEASPADVLAAQLDAEAIDQMAIAPALFDARKMAITEPNTYDCRTELRAIGCQWNASAKVWVARDQAMREQAIDLCRVSAGKKPMFSQPAMASLKAQAAADARQAAKTFGEKIADLKASSASLKGIPNGAAGGAVASARLPIDCAFSNEELKAEAQRRGFTIAKLGGLEPLAELLGQQDDEEDPFGKILELLK